MVAGKTPQRQNAHKLLFFVETLVRVVQRLYRHWFFQSEINGAHNASSHWCEVRRKYRRDFAARHLGKISVYLRLVPVRAHLVGRNAVGTFGEMRGLTWLTSRASYT